MIYPNILNADNLIKNAKYSSVEINGRWVAVRYCGCPSFISRLMATWMVFTGKADAVVFTGQ